MTDRFLAILSLFILFVSLTQSSQAQTFIDIDQSYVEAYAGELIDFTVGPHTDSTTLSIRTAPADASMDSLGRFTWLVPEELSEKTLTAEFLLMDQDEALLDVKSVVFRILEKPVSPPPTVIVESAKGDNHSVYHAQLGETLVLNIKGVSEASDSLSLNYYFNEDKAQTTLDGAQISLIGNELEFSWTADQTHLEQTYFSLTVVATDENGQSVSKTILLIVRKNNQSPYFIYPILDEYYISSNETLNVNLAAGDPDRDSIIYRLSIPSTLGKPTLSASGQFSWRLSEDQIMRLKSKFPMEVTVEATEVGVNNPFTIVKKFNILRSVQNQPPKILNLQNDRVAEGLTYRKTVFIQDANDNSQDLSIEIRGAPEGMKWEFTDNMLNITWTPGFDVIGVDLKPENFDMLLIVKDPYGYVDQKAFTLTVEHRENTEKTFEHYMEYYGDAVFMVETLSQIHQEMQIREEKVQTMKKGLSVLTMLFAAYTSTGNLYKEGSSAQSLIPYVGVLAVIAGGINAFGFNDLPKYSDIREQSFVMQQKLMYILAILAEYRIEDPNSPNLENVEFRENLENFQQWLVKDKLDFKRYYSKFMTLNYVKRTKRQLTKEAAELNREPSGLYFLNMNEF